MTIDFSFSFFFSFIHDSLCRSSVVRRRGRNIRVSLSRFFPSFVPSDQDEGGGKEGRGPWWISAISRRTNSKRCLSGTTFVAEENSRGKRAKTFDKLLSFFFFLIFISTCRSFFWIWIWIWISIEKSCGVFFSSFVLIDRTTKCLLFSDILRNSWKILLKTCSQNLIKKRERENIVSRIATALKFGLKFRVKKGVNCKT